MHPADVLFTLVLPFPSFPSKQLLPLASTTYTGVYLLFAAVMFGEASLMIFLFGCIGFFLFFVFYPLLSEML